MDRNREARRGAAAAAASGVVTTSNGLSRRRHRSSSSSLRDSPDEDGGVELQDSIRLRDRVKKERDLRDRERDRERERERERERAISSSSRSKRRRAAERILMHHNNNNNNSSRVDDIGVGVGVGDDSSEESVNDDEDDEDEDNHNHHTAHNSSNGGLGGGGVRLLPQAGCMPNHYHNHNHLQHRKSFPPSGNTTAPSTTTAKTFRAAPVWKSGDEMIGVSVPRKARSAATKRSHDWTSTSNGGGGNSGVIVGEQINRQASTSPVRQSLVPASTMTPAPPLSPSSSNVSVRKKPKPNNNGLKPRPPKSSSKSSSNPEELEIEIAEVLYGLMTQSQGPSKKEVASNDSKEANHRSNTDMKSQISLSNITQQTPVLAQNSSFSAGPLSAVAPKRKRPRQVSDSFGNSSARSSPISSTRAEIDQSLKTEVSVAPSTSSTPSSASVPVENGGVSNDLGGLVNSQAPPVPMKVDSDSNPVAAVEFTESEDLVSARGDSYGSLKKESPVTRTEESNREDAVTAIAAGLISASVNKDFAEAQMDGHREQKFQIDLMAPPPQMRSSCESERELDVRAHVEDQKPSVSRIDADKKAEEEKGGKTGNDDVVNVRAEEKAAKLVPEETESKKGVENKGRNIDLQLVLEKPERDNGKACNKLHGGGQKQLPLPPAAKVIKEEPHVEKTGQSSSFPLPMSMASWPGGLPPMGYMAPLQGVVSMDGNTVPSTPIQMPLFSQPRPKKCATHWYIARNIQNLQQLMKINPFWPAAAGSAALFGSKACNVNIVPSADLHASIAGRGVSSVQDKGQGVAIFPGHSGKDKGSQPANTADAGQRKQQILLQQTLPPVPPNNILQGPAFIFPLNQQQAAMAAAAARSGSAKSPALTVGGASSSASTATAGAVSSSGMVGVPSNAMSFSYPTMPTNEAQYLAILQNNGYPFPIPTVGANPNYRGPHPQPLPLFNGSFYSSQMIHPSQLQQQPQPPTASQSQQVQQSHQNTSMSSGSSSTQKHLQIPQQRPQGSAISGGSGSGNSQNFATKNRTTQQPQQPANQHGPKVHLENEVGGEDSRSNHDTRGARAPMSLYGQNFAMPMHAPNFALISPQTTLAGVPASSGSGHQSDKKQQQHPQPGLKTGIDSLPPQTFAMSFGPINGATTAGIDLSSMAQSHAIFQNFSEAGRPNIQMMAAAQAGQAKKNFRISDDGKSGGGDSSNSADDERKVLAGRAPTAVGQSIAFSRSDVADMSASANNVIESSARNLNLSSGPSRSSRSPMPNTMGAVSVQNAQLQAQLQQQHQQFIQLHKQQQHQQQQQQHHHHQQQQQQHHQQQLAGRSKTPATSNGSVFSDHLTSSSSIATKFPNAVSAFPQNLVQTSNGSPAQSPQWKSSARTATSQNPSSLASSTNSSLKNLPQQSGRSQTHTQISFVSNQKSASGPQGQPPANNQSPSPPMVVGSPTTSSISKGASGSPRTTTSASTGNKNGQASSLSTQQAKNSPSAPSQKSSPVGGRNVTSILGNPHVSSNSSSGAKTQAQQQLQQHIQQQQLPKNMQQAQLFFSNPYVQAQSQHSASSAASGNSGYYLQRRRSDQQQSPQQPPGSSAPSSAGIMSLCPVTIAGSSTTDPAKALAAAAAAAAASNMKGGGFPSQGVLHTSQISSQSSGNQHPLMPAGFSYVHTVPAAVQVKPTEQKQQAGNDNLHACWQPEKK